MRKVDRISIIRCLSKLIEYLILTNFFTTMTIEKLLNCGTCGCGMAEEGTSTTGDTEKTGTEEVAEVSEEGKMPAEE